MENGGKDKREQLIEAILKSTNKYTREQIISAIETKEKLIIELVVRQTSYSEEEARRHLELFDFNYLKVIREFLGLSNSKSKDEIITSTNQAIYKEIRGCMDNAAKRYRNKKEWEERQEQILQELKLQEENKLLTIKEED
tara:strand:+ start:151 stop:570 length:420 start_codon:yes stop_codon:yes gene_type:complete